MDYIDIINGIGDIYLKEEFDDDDLKMYNAELFNDEDLKEFDK
jgi:hypothetical protein